MSSLKSAPFENLYNYARFQVRYYDFNRFEGPKAGMTFPLALPPQWSVLETASLTCPMYARHIKRMNQLAAYYPEVNFLVLYVREGHPGERTPQHRSLEEKNECAERTRLLLKETRKIIVDSLDGDLHRKLGLYPNMLYLVRPDGVIAYRGDWAEPRELESLLQRRKSDLIVSSDRVRIEIPSPVIVWKILLLGGWVALWDFIRGFPVLLFHMVLKFSKGSSS